ncbi:MAG: hypothetical protein ACI85I_002014 [Arenicella sp.]|jgi:hypothetical protein
MFKDLINYELAESVTEKHLLEVAKRVQEGWMKNQAGFVKWEIHKSENGSYSDIVYWESEEAMKNAEKEMGNIPNAGEWFACYKEETIKGEKLSLVASF